MLQTVRVLFPAVCFKNAKQYEQAKDAYLKEAEYHTENKAYPLCTLSAVGKQDITVICVCFVIPLTYTSGFSTQQSKYLVL